MTTEESDIYTCESCGHRGSIWEMNGIECFECYRPPKLPEGATR